MARYKLTFTDSETGTTHLLDDNMPDYDSAVLPHWIILQTAQTKQQKTAIIPRKQGFLTLGFLWLWSSAEIKGVTA